MSLGRQPPGRLRSLSSYLGRLEERSTSEQNRSPLSGNTAAGERYFKWVLLNSALQPSPIEQRTSIFSYPN